MKPTLEYLIDVGYGIIELGGKSINVGDGINVLGEKFYKSIKLLGIE